MARKTVAREGTLGTDGDDVFGYRWVLMSVTNWRRSVPWLHRYIKVKICIRCGSIVHSDFSSIHANICPGWAAQRAEEDHALTTTQS